MASSAMSLDRLRRFAVARSLFAPTTLRRALNQLGFVQADPIRAPARAQDLILRHRVNGYRAGDLERRYVALGIEEDFFINYGFVTRTVEALMHPRPNLSVPAGGNRPQAVAQRRKEQMLLDFVAARREVHPQEVQNHFRQGTVRNYWGGSSHATTHMLDAMHYRGLLRVARRENGIRVYRVHRYEPQRLDDATRRARIDALVDVVVNIYSPLPARSLAYYIRRLRYAVPQWENEISSALQRARQRLRRATVDGVEWYWPANENPAEAVVPDLVRLLTPFDPVVHDRSRFQLLWGWTYRFEAYTPASKRKLGYYALPLLWRDRMIGWANLSLKDGTLTSEVGFPAGNKPHGTAFDEQLAAELDRMRLFLGRAIDGGETPRSAVAPPHPPRIPLPLTRPSA